jgi:UDP-glucose 4-epimerase
MRVRDARQTFLGIWLRRALENEEILVYGDGSQRRDLTYVDDAVAGFLLTAARDETSGRVYNLGGEGSVSLGELANLVTSAAGGGTVTTIPFPADRKSIDIGDFYADWSAIERDLGWRPVVPVEEGIGRTLDYYREHGERYWGDG